MNPSFDRYGSSRLELKAVPPSALEAPRRALAKARRVEAKMLRRIRRAVERGEMRRAEGLQRLYVRSFVGRLCAVAQVNPVLKSAQRARANELIAVASRICTSWPSDEAVKVVAKPKRDGGWRPVTIFGLERAASQALACKAIVPFHIPDPRQFAITGGGHNAAARLIIQSMSEGYKWFVGLDISSFYSSIERRSLPNIIPLPTSMVEHVICPPPSNAIRIERVGRALVGLRLAEASQSGISQGSRSSPLVAEIIVKSILAQFALDVRIINDADDFGIMARTKRDADAITLALTRATARSPAGCFLLRPKAHSGARRVSDGFDFLGYRFRKRQSFIDCQPSDANLIKFNTRVLGFATLLESDVIRAVQKFRRYVRQWWQSFPLVSIHLEGRDFFWGLHHVDEVVRRHRPIALPLARIAMRWDGNDYACLPPSSELVELARKIRRQNLKHQSNVPHWGRLSRKPKCE